MFEGSESAGHDRQDKPFAVWPLRPDPQDQMWTFCAAWLPGGPPPAGVIAPGEVRLGAVGCQVAEITHPVGDTRCPDRRAADRIRAADVLLSDVFLAERDRRGHA